VSHGRIAVSFACPWGPEHDEKILRAMKIIMIDKNNFFNLSIRSPQ
jgi:hypothetical protein